MAENCRSHCTERVNRRDVIEKTSRQTSLVKRAETLARRSTQDTDDHVTTQNNK